MYLLAKTLQVPGRHLDLPYTELPLWAEFKVALIEKNKNSILEH